MTGQKKIKPEPALLVYEHREWRVLREFPDYEISNDGRLRRATSGSNTKIGAHIRVGLSYGSSSYPKYGLTNRDGKRLFRNAHVLVAAEFLPPAPDGKPFVLHDDDNRLNCRDNNLKWGSHEDNRADAKRNERYLVGSDHPSAKKPWTRPRGEGHGSVKLTDEKVRAILADPRGPNAIARDYGVHYALITRIKNGVVWKHITNPAYNAMLEAGKNHGA